MNQSSPRLEHQAWNDSERWPGMGPLKDNHHWQYEFKERLRKTQTMKFMRGDFGGVCGR